MTLCVCVCVCVCVCQILLESSNYTSLWENYFLPELKFTEYDLRRPIDGGCEKICNRHQPSLPKYFVDQGKYFKSTSSSFPSC